MARPSAPFTEARRLTAWVRVAGRGPANAGGWFLKSLTHSHELRDPFILAYSLEGLAWVASTEHRAPRSARLLGAATGLRAVIGSPVAAPALHAHETLTTAVRGTIGADRFEREHAAGASLTIEEAVAYALDQP
jgi:hypothetical protein